MLIKFEVGLGMDSRQIEWILDAIPRVDDYVALGDYGGEVRSVMWVLTNDDGVPLNNPYVVVRFR